MNKRQSVFLENLSDDVAPATKQSAEWGVVITILFIL